MAKEKKGGGAPIIDPITTERICELWLQNQTLDHIAKVIKAENPLIQVSRQAIGLLVETKLRPIARQRLARPIGEVLAEVGRLRAWAYRMRDECRLGLTEETIEYGSDDQPADPKKDGKPKPPENDPALLKAALRKSKKKPVTAEEKAAAREMVVIRRTVKNLANTTACGFVDIVEYCIDFEAKIAGHFARNNTLDIRSEFRLGGLNPDAVNQEMYERVVKKVMEIRAGEVALAEAQED